MSRESDLALCIDLGTSGLKIGLVSLDGELFAHELHPVVTVLSDDGGAEQDAGQWWSTICEATVRLMSGAGTKAGRVRCVAVTGQYASTVPVDVNGAPTGPCLTWLDTRGGQYSRRAVGGRVQGYNARRALQFIRKSGGAPSTSGADPIGQILYLMNARPDVMARTRWLLEPVDFLTMCFSGVASATHASRLALWLTDNRALTRYDYDQQLVDMVGISTQYLPALQAFGTPVATVTPSVATRLGLDRETLVLTGIPDLHAAAFGSGGTELYQTHLALSTTSWISCPVPKKKTDVRHSIAAVPGLTDDSYLIINNQETGAQALEWLRDLLATSAHPMSFTDLTALAATSPPGAHGVTFSPWLAGERSPVTDKRARAGFANLSTATSTPDLVRAVMEGVATNSAWLFGHVEKFAGTTLSPVRLLGGGAQSTLWCQIYATALDREVEQVPQPMFAQLRGVALMAAVAQQRHRLSDVASLQPRGQLFEPDHRLTSTFRNRAQALPHRFRQEQKWQRHRSADRRPSGDRPSGGP